jgi:hypothetical protein
MRVTAGLLFALLAGACSKSLVAEEDAQVTDLPPLATEPAPAPSGMVPAEAGARGEAEAGAGAGAGAEAGARGEAGARAKAAGGAAADAGDAGNAGAACGDAPLRDCPLKAWMKANCAPAVMAQDLDLLAYAFDRIAAFAPPDSAGYTNWVSIANDGADAARAASIVGVKGACRGCHQQYKDRYKAGMRARALP